MHTALGITANPISYDCDGDVCTATDDNTLATFKLLQDTVNSYRFATNSSSIGVGSNYGLIGAGTVAATRKALQWVIDNGAVAPYWREAAKEVIPFAASKDLLADNVTGSGASPIGVLVGAAGTVRLPTSTQPSGGSGGASLPPLQPDDGHDRDTSVPWYRSSTVYWAAGGVGLLATLWFFKEEISRAPKKSSGVAGYRRRR